MLGDVELNEKCARLLIRRLRADGLLARFDLLGAIEAKGITLAHETARQLGHPRVVVIRKSVKRYMVRPLAVPVSSITSGKGQQLVLDGRDADRVRGRRLCLIEDVIATGGSVRAACALLAQAAAEVATIRALPGLAVAESAGDLAGTGRQVLYAEGIYFIRSEADLGDPDRLLPLGFRSLAPLYNEDNPLGDRARGDAGRGLTAPGRRVVERAWEIGFLVDIAHSNHRTQADLIDLALSARHPVHCTHGVLDEPVLELFGQRGLARPQAERLLQTGGLIGLSPHPGFRRFLDDIELLARRAPGQVVLGSDFCGITTPPVTFPAFAQRLAERCGENVARDFCARSLLRLLEKALPL
jgi:adenine phosphoribosyltransferase